MVTVCIASSLQANLVAPFEIWILHERPVAKFPLEQIVHVLLDQRLEEDVELREVCRRKVVVVRIAVADEAPRVASRMPSPHLVLRELGLKSVAR